MSPAFAVKSPATNELLLMLMTSTGAALVALAVVAADEEAPVACVAELSDERL
jgi:hypothetical protein